MLGLLVYLLVLFVVFGLVYYVTIQIPMPRPFRIAVNVVLALIAIIVLLGAIGIVPGWRLPHRL